MIGLTGLTSDTKGDNYMYVNNTITHSYSIARCNKHIISKYGWSATTVCIHLRSQPALPFGKQVYNKDKAPTNDQ